MGGVSLGHRRHLPSGAWLDLAALVALKVVVDVLVLRAGFTHVSDDDYARVVIAQGFAHAPSVDPSGTSWLPFPFWVTGIAMSVFGRRLAVARAVACVLGVASVAAPYLAMRAAACGRVVSVVGNAIVATLPWCAWLGVATVPEAPTAALVACGAIAAAVPEARVAGALALLAATLSRYEAWPVSAVFALACVVRPGDRRRRDLAAAGLALAGPALWMTWNAYAHGSAFHFVARVAAYRQAIGAAATPMLDKLLGYPRALVATAPLSVGLALPGAIALRLDRALRARWGWPVAAALATMAFLVYGDLRDGAPTHHPERALLPVITLACLFGVDGIAACARCFARGRALRESVLVGAGTALGLAWVGGLPAHYRAYPARSASETRTRQIAHGEALAREGVERFTVVPCAYEHFALVAGYGAPERVTIDPVPVPPARDPSGDECPRVERP